jgi:hypothetical protein
MRNLLKIAVAIGLAIVFIPKPEPQKQRIAKRTHEDRRQLALAKCKGRLYYDAGLDLYFDMHGKVGTALDV